MLAIRPKTEPLYARASEAVENIIDAQGLKPGDKLPPETRLAELLGVSRSTIREALRELERRGRISRVHGLGTIIAHAVPIVTGLSTLESLESIAARQGWKCGTSNVEIRMAALPTEVAAALGRRPRERVTWLGMVKTRDSQPIWQAETWIPSSTLTIDEVRERFQTSTFDLLRSSSPRADYASSKVSAAAATQNEAILLKIHRRSPLVILTEVFYEAPERALWYSRNALIPGGIELQIGRRPPPDGADYDVRFRER
jgi:GntR family transcriptional regulator